MPTRAASGEHVHGGHAAAAPFLDAGALLYSGPWVAERLAEFGDFLADHSDDVLPVIATIISGGARFDAVDVFRAQYRLAELKAVVARLFTGMDVLVLPTIGTTFTIAAGARRPDRDQHHARPLHPLRQPARPLCDGRTGRHDP